MPSFCAVYNCNSRSERDKLKFFRFPAINTKSALKELSEKRQKAWLMAIKRTDITQRKILYLRVCSKLFISGKSATLKDRTNPDWVPNLEMGHNLNKCKTLAALYRIKRAATRSTRNSTCTEDREEIEWINNAEQAEQDPEELNSCTVGTQTDIGLSDMNKFDVIYLQEEVIQLSRALAKYEITLDGFKDDAKTLFFTGISTYVTLKILYETLEQFIPESTDKLSKFQMFYILLSRLRLDLLFTFLSYQLNVSRQTVSKYFYLVLDVAYFRLQSLVYFPDREILRKTMPDVFINCFKDKFTTIIDCFEVFIEKSSNMIASSQSWSNYKHSHTIKYLIGITPQGTICFISDGFGGRCSDKYIAENSGFLNELKEGDVIMADRGFLIAESIKNVGATMEIQAFTKGKSQLHPVDLAKTRNIANVRIHVERIIGLLRLKYTLLARRKFPMSILTQVSDGVNT